MTRIKKNTITHIPYLQTPLFEWHRIYNIFCTYVIFGSSLYQPFLRAIIRCKFILPESSEMHLPPDLRNSRYLLHC